MGGDRWGFIQSPPRQSQAGCVVGSLLSLQCSVTSVTASHAPSYPLQWHWALQQTLGCRKTAGPSAPGRAAFSQHPRMCCRESTLPLPRLLCARGQALPTPGAARHDARPPPRRLWPSFRPLQQCLCPGGCVSRMLPPPGHTARHMLPVTLAQLHLSVFRTLCLSDSFCFLLQVTHIAAVPEAIAMCHSVLGEGKAPPGLLQQFTVTESTGPSPVLEASSADR